MTRRVLAASLAALMMASPAIALAQSTSTYSDTAPKKKTTTAHKKAPKKAKKATAS
jgi:hypothetical protein